MSKHRYCLREQAAREIVEAGGRQIAGPFEIPVGCVAIVADPFGHISCSWTSPKATT
ncbi:MAG: VOC family protein [Pseudonocardiaceae bacterium]